MTAISHVSLLQLLQPLGPITTASAHAATLPDTQSVSIFSPGPSVGQLTSVHRKTSNHQLQPAAKLGAL
jgi:hypothetical protein